MPRRYQDEDEYDEEYEEEEDQEEVEHEEEEEEVEEVEGSEEEPEEEEGEEEEEEEEDAEEEYDEDDWAYSTCAGNKKALLVRFYRVYIQAVADHPQDWHWVPWPKWHAEWLPQRCRESRCVYNRWVRKTIGEESELNVKRPLIRKLGL